MKNLSLVLMMGLGFASFAQAEEECITTGQSHMMTSDGKCNVVSDAHFYSVNAICRNKIGAGVRQENRTCVADQSGAPSYEVCGLREKKVKGYKGLLKKDASNFAVCGKPNDLPGETVNSIELSWKNKVCFTGGKDGCHGAGKQTEEGCLIKDRTEREFFYDNKCTIAANPPAPKGKCYVMGYGDCMGAGRLTELGCALGGMTNAEYFTDLTCKRKGNTARCWVGSPQGFPAAGQKQGECKLGMRIKEPAVEGAKEREWCQIGNDQFETFSTNNHCMGPTFGGLINPPQTGAFGTLAPTQTSDRKVKKLKPDTRPGGMMAKPATIPMESVKSNSAK